MHLSALPQLALLMLASKASAECYNYVLINSRGTGEPQGESLGFRGMIKEVLAELPGGDSYNTVYPAAPDATQETTHIGSEDIERVINAGLADCPQQEYALLGYSQGATVCSKQPRFCSTRKVTNVRDLGYQRSSSGVLPKQFPRTGH